MLNKLISVVFVVRLTMGAGATFAQMGGGMGMGGGVDLSAAAEKLEITEDELREAFGGPPPDFAAAAEKLGVTEEELRELVPIPTGGMGAGMGGAGGGMGMGAPEE